MWENDLWNSVTTSAIFVLQLPDDHHQHNKSEVAGHQHITLGAAGTPGQWHPLGQGSVGGGSHAWWGAEERQGEWGAEERQGEWDAEERQGEWGAGTR